MEKITTLKLLEKKKRGKKITALTAYDAPFARMMDEAGIDIILVGDSVGMAVLGRENTLSVTMEEMIHHTCAVTRVTQRAMVVADMPFMSFQLSPEKALENAGRLIKEGSAHAVKLEGGKRMEKTIRHIVDAGIPVMGHVGLTPQSVNQFGGFKMQGKNSGSAQQIITDAKAVEKAGAFAVVIEAVPCDLAEAITKELHIPTIGIGAGLECDGQVLVMQDMLGISDKTPKFVKHYADIRAIAQEAFNNYIKDVESGEFPSEEQSYRPPKARLKVVGQNSNSDKKRGLD